MSRTPAIPPMSDPIEASLRRELYLFAMYRVMEAGILAFLAFSPLAGIISAPDRPALARAAGARSEEHTSELQSLMRISYAVFCLKKKTTHTHKIYSNLDEP